LAVIPKIWVVGAETEYQAVAEEAEVEVMLVLMVEPGEMVQLQVMAGVLLLIVRQVPWKMGQMDLAGRGVEAVEVIEILEAVVGVLNPIQQQLIIAMLIYRRWYLVEVALRVAAAAAVVVIINQQVAVEEVLKTAQVAQEAQIPE